MNMVPYDYHKIEDLMFYKRTKLDEILDEFLGTGEICVEMVDYTHVNAKSCQNSFTTRIKKRRIQNMIKVMIRGDHVFLVRVDKIDE